MKTVDFLFRQPVQTEATEYPDFPRDDACCLSSACKINSFTQIINSVNYGMETPHIFRL